MNVPQPIITEIMHSMVDPIYFIHNHVKLGGEPIILSDTQIDWISEMQQDRVTELGDDRASGRTTTMLLYTLWLAIFKTDLNILCLSHNMNGCMAQSRIFCELLDSLPEYMKASTIHKAKRVVEFDSRCRVAFYILQPSVGKGMAISFLIIDNSELVPLATSLQLYTSLLPCLAATNGKVAVTGSQTEWSTSFNG